MCEPGPDTYRQVGASPNTYRHKELGPDGYSHEEAGPDIYSHEEVCTYSHEGPVRTPKATTELVRIASDLVQQPRGS